MSGQSPSDPSNRELLDAFSNFAKAFTEEKLRMSNAIPDWLKWVSGFLVSAILLGAGWANLRRDIEANREKVERVDIANKAAHARMNGFVKTNSRNMRTVWAKVFPGVAEPPDGDGGPP